MIPVPATNGGVCSDEDEFCSSATRYCCPCPSILPEVLTTLLIIRIAFPNLHLVILLGYIDTLPIPSPDRAVRIKRPLLLTITEHEGVPNDRVRASGEAETVAVTNRPSAADVRVLKMHRGLVGGSAAVVDTHGIACFGLRGGVDCEAESGVGDGLDAARGGGVARDGCGGSRGEKGERGEEDCGEHDDG